MKEYLRKLKDIFINNMPNYKCYILIILIGLIISIPLTVNGWLNTHDGFSHLSRNYATVKGILDGQFPSLIAANFCGGFGYSWNLYYPPLSTYITAFFKIFVPTFVIATKLTLFFAIIFSGITMFKLMWRLTKNNKISTITAIIYMTSTYFVTDIYERMAMGEIIAYIFIPILLSGLYDIFYKEGKENYLLTIGAVGIILSHNISTLLVVIACLILVIFHINKLVGKSSLRIWKNLIINGCFIVTIVLFFYGPFLQATLTSECLATKGGMSPNAYGNSIYIYQLIFGKNQRGYSLDLKSGIDKEMNFSLGIPIIAGLLFTPLAFKKVKNKKLYCVAILIGVVFAYMSTNLCPWKELPKVLINIQFPWRMLLISTTMFSIISGINIGKITEKNGWESVLVVTSIILVYICQYISCIVSFDNIFDEGYLYETTKVETIDTSKDCSSYEYLPIKARSEYLISRSDSAIILSGTANIENENKDGLYMTFDVIGNSEDTTIELPYIYYLGYYADINGNKLEINESDNGFLSITIPSGIAEGTVTIKYKGTVLSKVCTVISIVGFIGFCCYMVYSIVKNKKIKRENL